MKQSVLVLWVVLALCMMLASGWIASTARIVFWGMAVIHVVEFVIKRGVLERAGGSMAGHFLQTLICTTIFYGFGFGLFGEINRFGLFGIVLAIWLLQLLPSPIWLKHFRFGPMEWLWRSLTYWKPQSMMASAHRPR